MMIDLDVEHFQRHGAALIADALPRTLIAECKAAAARRYLHITQWIAQGGDAAVQQYLGSRYVPTASSLQCAAVLEIAQIERLWQGLGSGPAAAILEGALGASPLCDLDESWVRRQYAPAKAPPGHAPHSWHQDGALRCDFADAQDGLLPMLTCWLPLDTCGVDAPGLEFFPRRLNRRLRVEELSDEAVQTAFAADAFCTPALAPGDALLLAGGTLHRTHIRPGMTNNRTSVELRLFAEVPARLSGDRFCDVRLP